MSMDFRQLLPDPKTTELEPLLDSLRFAERATAERPYVIANFIASVDGRATLKGRSGQLGDDGDSTIFHGLRERVDAVLVGTVTLQVERYGRIVGKAERRERRLQRGLAPEPLACVISRSGMVPTDIPLFQEPEARIVVFSASEVDSAGYQAQVEFVSVAPGELTLTTVLRRLREQHGVRTLLCEGGPTLFGSMLEEHAVDELFLTIAPKLAGGGRGPTISSGAELAIPGELRLGWLLERRESLYLRYLL
jgi:riboflavin-specific deaminase-like protein